MDIKQPIIHDRHIVKSFFEDMKNKKLLKILTDEISIRADKKNIVTAQCNKKDKIENKF